MARIGKYFFICFSIMLVVSVFLMIKPTNAETIPTPSIPQFTMHLADHSYDMPAITTSTTDPYNGKVITNTQPGYRVHNNTIDITIVNQPCPSTINGNITNVYYDVRIKGHYAQDWTELYLYYGNAPTQSNSGHTVISLPANYRVGDELDVQVQAAIGYKIITYIGHPPMDVYTESVDFQNSASDWSPTQTFTMPDTSASVSSLTPAPTPTPTVPEFPFITIFTLLFLIPLIIFFVRKTTCLKAYNSA